LNRLLFAGLLAGLTSCPGPTKSNPAQVWLYMNGNETMVRLVDFDPPPF
jgi:hypothetical protein